MKYFGENSLLKLSQLIKSKLDTKANKSGDTFSGAITIPQSSVFSTPANTVIRPLSDGINTSAIAGDMIWHDLFSFCKISVPKYYNSTDNSTWTESTLNKSLFAQKQNNSISVLNDTFTGARWVWGTDNDLLSWSGGLWLVIGVTYQVTTASYTVKFESSADNSTWTTRHSSTSTHSTAPIYFRLSSYEGNRYLRLTITKSTTDAGAVNIGQIRLLTPRYGNQGNGIELQYPYTWDNDQKLTFNAASINGVSVPASPKFTDTRRIALCTCSTAAGTSQKVVALDSSNSDFTLEKGSIIGIKFSASNTASNVTLNVNNTGAKSIWYNSGVFTSTSNTVCGYANRYTFYMYDGTYWVWLNHGLDANTTYSNASLGQGYGTCTTAESTTAKLATVSNYSLAVGGIASIRFTYNVPASATLNINSAGARSIFYRGSAISAGIISAGDTASFTYDGTNYILLTIDKSQRFKRGSVSITSDDTSQINIPIGLLNVDTLLVYHNGILLDPDTHYTATTTTLTFLDYTAKAGDTITFVNIGL